MFQRRLSISSHLELLDMRHVDALYQLTVQNRAHLRRWLPWVDAVQTPADTRSFVEAALKQFAANQGFQAGIWHGEALAGVIGYHKIDWTNRLTTIGYWLGERFERQGLMTLAARALIEHAFRDLSLNRVEIRCATANARSRAIPLRLGFTEEGVIRDAEWLYDHYVDHVVYGLLARDWRELGRR